MMMMMMQKVNYVVLETFKFPAAHMVQSHAHTHTPLPEAKRSAWPPQGQDGKVDQ